MTDDKPEIIPCGWCGKEPHHRSDIDSCQCSNKECLTRKVGDFLYRVETWNETTVEILAQRRKDFNAGMGAERAGFVSEYEVDSAFDDYLKAQHGEEEK